ncbi:MAG TPA: TIGR02281 family clan AA aspartic protease [Xanthobacteraceae bacterium]|jgi:aspartyl protease family protein
MNKLVIFAAMILGAGVVAARVADRAVPTAAPPSATAAAQQSAAADSSNSRTVTLSRSSDGHFRTEARVDGSRLALIVDTGASQIALRASDAARLGIHPTARDYTVRVTTANGITRAAPVELQRVEVEDIVVHNVPALVQPDEALGVNLLGMSFLSRIRWTHERGKLILEQ